MNCYDIVDKHISSGVTKYVHRNGMETAIKTVPTCGIEKQKAVLFVSSSVGCEQKCPICHLTTNGYRFENIDDRTVINACKAAIDEFDISDRYLKISFMGMGDYFTTRLNCFEICRDVFRYVMINDICLGIDGVDIGTSVPKIYGSMQAERVLQLDHYLNALFIGGESFNPNNNYSKRSFVRIFISLHSVNNKTKSLLMPRSQMVSNMLQFSRQFYGKNDIIFHCVFIKRINDSLEDIYQLMKFAEWMGPDYEFRLLRFNKSNNSKLEESDRVDEIIGLFNSNSEVNFKYQVSAGSEISASCGQFICKE